MKHQDGDLDVITTQRRLTTFGCFGLVFLVCLLFAYLEYRAGLDWSVYWLGGAFLAMIGAWLYAPVAALPEQKQFGDAHWATLEEVKNYTGLLKREDGIPLGYARDNTDEKHPRWRKLTYSGDRHLVTIAPNRSGKGTNVIIPTLLEYDASCFVLDPKGENALITARQRQRMGHKVIILNPFYELHDEFAARGFRQPHRFNPLLSLDVPAMATGKAVALRSGVPRGKRDGIRFLADVARMAEALVYNQSKDPHWSDSARSLVECLILYVCTEPGQERSLSQVRELLMGPPQELRRILATMATSPYRPLRQKVGQFLEMSPEILSIISTARTQTKDLDDPAIAESLSGDDFRFIDLKRGKMTVYLVMNADDMKAYSRWLRLLLTSALNALMGTSEKGHKPVLFLLDEFNTLGNMSLIENTMAYFAGFGIQLWPFLQDYNQLEVLYEKRAPSFLANAGVIQYFTPNDPVTAEHISDRCGVRTVYTANLNFSTGADGSKSSSTGYSVTQTPLIYPQEVYDMPTSQQIIFHHGMSFPIRARRWPYFDRDTSIPGAADYTGLYDPNPHAPQSDNTWDGEDAEDEQQWQSRNGDGRAHDDHGRSADSRMKRNIALRILELEEGATRQQIEVSYRRLMQHIHPDKGGSTYFAQQLNEAREVLLGL